MTIYFKRTDAQQKNCSLKKITTKTEKQFNSKLYNRASDLLKRKNVKIKCLKKENINIIIFLKTSP